MWTPSPKQKRYGAIAFGIIAIGLFLWLFMRSRNVVAASALSIPESAPIPQASGDNLYAINFPASQPSSLPGTNIVLGGVTIGNNCGCCDNGTELVPNATMSQNLAAVAGGDEVLLSMLSNFPATGQSDLGYAFN